MLTRSRVFTAQPEASRIGPKLRLRSFKAATTIEGPEIARITPNTASGICHQERLRKPVTIEAIAVPMAPIARPIAAKMPAKRAASNACAAGVAAAAAGAAAAAAAPAAGAAAAPGAAA